MYLSLYAVTILFRQHRLQLLMHLLTKGMQYQAMTLD